MKYVIFTNPEKLEGSKDRHVVVLVSEYVTHQTTHGMLRENDVRVHRQSKYCLPHSAGFFRVEVKDGAMGVTTFGRSESMELEPQAGDSDLILAAIQRGY